MDSQDFEELTAELLRSMGFVDVRRVGRTSDRGVDVEAYQVDAFGHKTKYIVQCKFYDEGLVSSPDLQKFIGAMSIHDAGRGIFVTSSSFTTEAKIIAARNDITLIDGVQLSLLIEQHNLEEVNKKQDQRLRPKKLEIIKTHIDLYNSLSFGKQTKEGFIIPNIEPLAVVEGLAIVLENIATVKLDAIEVFNARIETRGFFGVHWNVDKTWHDSQGRVRNSWRGKGLYVTDERGNEIYDVGSGRSGVKKSPLVDFFSQSLHRDWKEISKKINVDLPKVKRIAYKKRIKISGIPRQDVHCKVNKYYIATKIAVEYQYRNKKCSFIADCFSGDVENNLPIYMEDEIRRLVILEKPELETQNFSAKLKGDKWEVKASDLHLEFHKNSGNLVVEKTPSEKIIENTSKKAKGIFSDVTYDKNISLSILLGKSCDAKWELSYTSKNGKLFFTATQSGKLSLRKQINENYALELAQKENKNKSELLSMTRSDRGFIFNFLDDKFNWVFFVHIDGNSKILSKKLTWKEAVNRGKKYLIDKGVEEPILITKPVDQPNESYDIEYRSELDGVYFLTISHSPTNFSCELAKQKITGHRARYIAESLSSEKIRKFNRRFFGLGNSWNAEIVDEEGNVKKIRIQADGKIV